jgi:methyltransferase-like protein/SAM-dependent methyltransferase
MAFDTISRERALSSPGPENTASSYDHVPYGSLAFPQTHPDRLATIGRMFGLSTLDAGRCRVLELGCASGGNLIPMAFNLPDAEFVGIDLSKAHVDAAAATVRTLGLGNVRFARGSIAAVDESWGHFDYIICHGVFSWVEADVQDAILRVASDNLAGHGVAYVSYNTYPGWHMREMVRHMMRYHSAGFEDVGEQIEQARALLTFLEAAADRSGPYGQLLSREVDRLRPASDSYLYHEHLEQTNAPLYFHQFVVRAEAAGLQYLAEADVSDMLSSVFERSIAQTLERISPDLVHLEQYMDFVRNRQFRQTLLCHDGLRPTRALSPAFMRGLMLSCRAVTDSLPLDLSSETPVVFQIGKQRATVSLPASKAAFSLLTDAWPHAVDLDELAAGALLRAAPFIADAKEAQHAMMGDLLQAVLYGMIRLHTQQLSCTNAPSETPRAHPLAAHLASQGTVVVNAHHEMVKLEPMGVEVVRLADGQRSRTELLDALVARVNSGALPIVVDSQRDMTESKIRRRLERELERTLASLTRSAVLVG